MRESWKNVAGLTRHATVTPALFAASFIAALNFRRRWRTGRRLPKRRVTDSGHACPLAVRAGGRRGSFTAVIHRSPYRAVARAGFPCPGIAASDTQCLGRNKRWSHSNLIRCGRWSTAILGSVTDSRNVCDRKVSIANEMRIQNLETT